jgi:hypothetical protein
MKTVLSYSPRKVATYVKVYNGVSATVLVVLIILCFLAGTDLMSTGSAEYRQLIVARLLLMFVSLANQLMFMLISLANRDRLTITNRVVL